MLWPYLTPLLRYRGALHQLGVPFLILCALALPCWLVVRVYRHRALGKRVSFRREVLLLTGVVYLLGVAAVTLTPNRSSRVRAAGAGGIELHPRLASLTCSQATLSSGSNRGFCLDNAVGNVVLFIPLGILLPLVWRRLRFSGAVSIAIALSSSVEILQYVSSAWGSYRAADVNDVILNVFGACLGLALVSLLRLRQGGRPAVVRA